MPTKKGGKKKAQQALGGSVGGGQTANNLATFNSTKKQFP